jgi:hypothetical protein
MSNSEENIFAAPEAELTNKTMQNKPVLQFQRISAWFVFFIGLITLGIYNVYWLYSRTLIANNLTKENKVNINLLYSYVSLFSIGIVASIADIGSLSFIVQIINLVVYIFLVFSIRRALIEIINAGSETHTHLNGILTFLFSSIYFQYKINEAIDKQK